MVSVATAVNVTLPVAAGGQDTEVVNETLFAGAATEAIVWPLALKVMLVMKPDGFEAAAVAVTVVAVPTTIDVPLVGLVIPTEGAALIATLTLEETPRLPKLSVTRALRV